MAKPVKAEITAERRAPWLSALLTALALSVALWSYSTVILPGTWGFVAFALIVIVAVTGAVMRRLLVRAPRAAYALVPIPVQLLVGMLAATTLIAAPTATAGVVPTADTARLVNDLLVQSASEIANGIVPIGATPAIAALVGCAFAVVTVLVDLLVSQRLVILAAATTTLVGLAPILLSFGEVNIVWFVLQAIVVAMLLRFAARRDRRLPRAASVALAAAVTTGALVAAFVLAPGLPMLAALPGLAPALVATADLDLGQDLRRPQPIEVIRVTTTADTAPYLRLATMTRFDGEVWTPDAGPQQLLRAGYPRPEWGTLIATERSTVTVNVTGVSISRLPLPYAAQSVTGVTGDWRGLPGDHTALSTSADARDQRYTVTASTAAPTLEQMQATVATSPAPPDLPDSMPPIIAETAREVTADATNDYDRLLALQDWFRSEFDYSLEAPVAEGFDGSGVDAVATFLDRRTGYCVHFSGAFALMAGSLGIPVRIAVGYLPGTATSDTIDDETVYSVMSDQLHAWPEAYFRGIGWVPFEPTATLGVPTDFQPGETEAPSSETPETTAPTQAPNTNVPTAQPERDDPDAGAPTGGSTLNRLDPTPITLAMIAALVLVMLPGVIRLVQRILRRTAARRGDAMAAWTELTATLIDLGIPASPAQSARERAAELVRKRGANSEALAALVAGVERASYAAEQGEAHDWAAPLDTVLTDLADGADGAQKVRAKLWPASLFQPRRAPAQA